MGTVLGGVTRGVVRVPGKALMSMLRDFRTFIGPYLPLFGREESRKNARRAVEGLLSKIERKSAEPLASFHNLPRRAMQRFIGAGPWMDGPLIDLLCQQVAMEIGSDDGVLIIDRTSFTKKGDNSVGVARQWNGRLGKIDNCQTGVYLSYASRKGHTLLDYRLYLPEEWAEDMARREECYVPKDVVFRTSWELANEMLITRAGAIRHAWIVGDDEFGRPGEFRDRLTMREEKYALEAPSTTYVRILGRKPHPGRRPNPAPAVDWVSSLSPRDWKLYTIRDTTKGPLQVEVAWTRVVTNRKPRTRKGDWTREEVLLVLRTLGRRPETKYFFCTPGTDIRIEDRIRAACTRWCIEDCFERAKGEVGLAHYEVRSWTGWHHHMTLALIALWFLVRQHCRLKAAFPPLHGFADAHLHRGIAAQSPPHAEGDRGSYQQNPDEKRASKAPSLGSRCVSEGGDRADGMIVTRTAGPHVAQ